MVISLGFLVIQWWFSWEFTKNWPLEKVELTALTKIHGD